MGQTLGLHQDPVSYEPYSGACCCLGAQGQNDRRTSNAILSDIWSLLISQGNLAVFGVCQHLKMISAERNVDVWIDYNLHGQYGGVHTVGTLPGDAKLPFGLPGWLGENTASPKRDSQ